METEQNGDGISRKNQTVMAKKWTLKDISCDYKRAKQRFHVKSKGTNGKKWSKQILVSPAWLRSIVSISCQKGPNLDHITNMPEIDIISAISVPPGLVHQRF